MSKKQAQIEIEDETTVVRVLSAVFMTLMILIISSYSDLPQADLTQKIAQETLKDTTTLSIKHSEDSNIATSIQPSIIKAHINTPIQSLIIYK